MVQREMDSQEIRCFESYDDVPKEDDMTIKINVKIFVPEKRGRPLKISFILLLEQKLIYDLDLFSGEGNSR